MSRNTANSCSRIPRIILPSTKAFPGAFLRASFKPRCSWTNFTSKSRFSSRINFVSSVPAPAFNTARAQIRNREYSPPAPLSLRRAISLLESISRLPSGRTSAFIFSISVSYGYFTFRPSGKTYYSFDTPPAMNPALASWKVGYNFLLSFQIIIKPRGCLIRDKPSRHNSSLMKWILKPPAVI